MPRKRSRRAFSDRLSCVSAPWFGKHVRHLLMQGRVALRPLPAPVGWAPIREDHQMLRVSAVLLSVIAALAAGVAVGKGPQAAISQVSSADGREPQAEEQAEARVQGPARYERELTLNGPTGWVVTDNGKFRFVRLGTGALRDIVFFNGFNPKDIASVTWDSHSSDAVVRLRNGQTSSANQGNILQLSYEGEVRFESSYGLSPGFPIVIRDRKTGKDSQLYFPNFRSLRSLQFDPPAEWEKGKRVSVVAAPTIAPEKRTSAPTSVNREPPRFRPLEVGMRICRVGSGFAKFPLNIAYLGEQLTETISGSVTLTGYVEASRGPRVQIRMGSITFIPMPGQKRQSRPHRLGDGESETLNEFNYNGTNLKDGTIFWDRADAWYDCE